MVADKILTYEDISEKIPLKRVEDLFLIIEKKNAFQESVRKQEELEQEQERKGNQK